MLKAITAFILLCAFLAQTFTKTFVVVDYLAQAGTYAKDCENKAKPLLKCGGKCQMMKKLDKEEKKDEQNPHRKADNKNELIFITRLFNTEQDPDIPGSISYLLSVNSGKEIKMSRSILRPPIG